MKAFAILAVVLAVALAFEPAPFKDVCIAELSWATPKIASGPLRGYRYMDFNVISFADFTTVGAGDVEGRLAVKGNVKFGDQGFSIGNKIDPDTVHAAVAPSEKARLQELWAAQDYLPYSLVFGGQDICWTSGSLSPETAGFFSGEYEAPDEVCLPYYLYSQQKGYCTAGQEGTCLNDDFNSMLQYYRDWVHQQAITAPTGEVRKLHYGDGLEFIGNPYKYPSRLVFRVSSYDWAKVHYFTTKNIKDEQELIIVIVQEAGDLEPVVFPNSPFPHPSNKIAYVFDGTGPKVVVQGSVRGSIIAPDRTFDQPHGVVDEGVVIVGDVIQLHQINYMYCPPACPDQRKPCQDTCCDSGETCYKGVCCPDGNFCDYKGREVCCGLKFNTIPGEGKSFNRPKPRRPHHQEVDLVAEWNKKYEPFTFTTDTCEPNAHGETVCCMQDQICALEGSSEAICCGQGYNQKSFSCLSENNNTVCCDTNKYNSVCDGVCCEDKNCCQDSNGNNVCCGGSSSCTRIQESSDETVCCEQSEICPETYGGNDVCCGEQPGKACASGSGSSLCCADDGSETVWAEQCCPTEKACNSFPSGNDEVCCEGDASCFTNGQTDVCCPTDNVCYLPPGKTGNMEEVCCASGNYAADSCFVDPCRGNAGVGMSADTAAFCCPAETELMCGGDCCTRDRCAKPKEDSCFDVLGSPFDPEEFIAREQCCAADQVVCGNAYEGWCCGADEVCVDGPEKCAPRCPEGWTLEHNTCVRAVDGEFTQASAVTFCANYFPGSHLCTAQDVVMNGECAEFETWLWSTKTPADLMVDGSFPIIERPDMGIICTPTHGFATKTANLYSGALCCLPPAQNGDKPYENANLDDFSCVQDYNVAIVMQASANNDWLEWAKDQFTNIVDDFFYHNTGAASFWLATFDSNGASSSGPYSTKAATNTAIDAVSTGQSGATTMNLDAAITQATTDLTGKTNAIMIINAHIKVDFADDDVRTAVQTAMSNGITVIGLDQPALAGTVIDFYGLYEDSANEGLINNYVNPSIVRRSCVLANCNGEGYANLFGNLCYKLEAEKMSPFQNGACDETAGYKACTANEFAEYAIQIPECHTPLVGSSIGQGVMYTSNGQSPSMLPTQLMPQVGQGTQVCTTQEVLCCKKL